MPRAFSESERERIRQHLVAVAREHFSRYGYRKASIGEIARDAGIGKGSVYLFFASKAELLLSVALEVEAELRAQLLEEMRTPFSSAQERLRHFLWFQFEALRDHPFLAILVDPPEATALFRDLPDGVMEELRTSDDRFFAGLVEQWQQQGEIAPVDPALFGALSRAIYAMSLQRNLIAEEVFPGVVDLVIDSLSRTLAPAEEAKR